MSGSVTQKKKKAGVRQETAGQGTSVLANAAPEAPSYKEPASGKANAAPDEGGRLTQSNVAADFIAIANDLEGQVARMLELRGALEEDLFDTRRKLSERTLACERLEEEVQRTREQAALVEPLRKDIAFAEEERDDAVRRLREAKAQLEHLTEAHRSGSELLMTSEQRLEVLSVERTDLEARTLNLKTEKVDLVDRLKVSEMARSTLERELESRGSVILGLRADLRVARQAIDVNQVESTDLQRQLEAQDARCKALLEAKQKCDREVEALEATKNALRVMRTRLRESEQGHS